LELFLYVDQYRAVLTSLSLQVSASQCCCILT